MVRNDLKCNTDYGTMSNEHVSRTRTPTCTPGKAGDARENKKIQDRMARCQGTLHAKSLDK